MEVLQNATRGEEREYIEMRKRVLGRKTFHMGFVHVSMCEMVDGCPDKMFNLIFVYFYGKSITANK